MRRLCQCLVLPLCSTEYNSLEATSIGYPYAAIRTKACHGMHVILGHGLMFQFLSLFGLVLSGRCAVHQRDMRATALNASE